MGTKEAKQAAQFILDERWDGKFPVDVIGIAQAMGVAVLAIANENSIYSGAYTPTYAKNDNRPTILVNQEEPPTRQRFTIAHELGHHVLHGDESFRDPLHQVPGLDPKEVEANAFAAALLMPDFEFRVVAESGKYNVSALARLFFVSPAAIGNRLESLGY